MTCAPTLGTDVKNRGSVKPAAAKADAIALFVASTALAEISAIALPPNPPPTMRAPSAPWASETSTAISSSGH